MNKNMRKNSDDVVVRSIERKYGVDLGYTTDAQMHRGLIKRGLPSLSKLLKMTRRG